MPGKWYALTQEEIVAYFQADLKHGLSDKEARQRLAKFGPNQLSPTPQVMFRRLFFKQWKSIPFMALLAATVIATIYCAPADYVVMLVLLLLAALLCSALEYRMEGAAGKIMRLSAPQAKARRGGQERQVPAVELVPGDIVMLAEGDLVPADMRLLDTEQLEIDESVLTGKPAPVRKTEEIQLAADLSLEDTRNMAYMHTVVTRGRGLGLVVHTGRTTEIGYLAGIGQTDERGQTPLQRRLAWYGDGPAVFSLLAGAAVVVLGSIKGAAAGPICLMALCLAVAVVPVGLPAVVAAALAGGASRMCRRGAVIRKLRAVHALGDTTLICANNTEIFTGEEMMVRKIAVDGNTFTVTGKGYDPKGELAGTGDKLAPGFTLLMKAAALCNNAVLKRGSINITGIFRGLTRRQPVSKWSVTGGATEGALLVLAVKAGFWREKLELEEQRVAELPFTPERRMMTVVCRKSSGSLTAYVKGAPETLLALCTHRYLHGKISLLSARDREEILAQNEIMAKDGLRLLAFACRELPAGTGELSGAAVEQQLVFLGLAGMNAPLQHASVKAVQTCRRAGIKVVLLTGEHPLTAQALARELGIVNQDEKILTGSDLELMPARQLTQSAGEVALCARVTPAQKLLIVDALKQSGHIVAVTGSGSKDAAAVREADIGIAMGLSGAGVTRDAADLVLAEDQFPSIIAAVEESRGVYHNIRQSIRCLLTCGAGAAFCTLLAVLAGLPLPLVPLQILWANAIINSIPALSFSVAPDNPNLMARPRHPAGGGAWDRGLTWRVITDGAIIGVSTVLAFNTGLSLGEAALSCTMAFNVLVFSHLILVLTCRNEFYCRHLAGAVLIACALQAVINFVPSLQAYFHLVHLGPAQWACVWSFALLPAAFSLLLRRIAGKIEKKIMYLRVRLG